MREKFKELVAIYGQKITISELNQKMPHWLFDEYGMNKHGTTHREPYPVFLDEEKPKLIHLPEQPFDAAFWKEATVHPDHYIQVQKKSYSVPHPYVGKKVWVKVSQNTVQIYHNEQLIKQHTVPRHGYRQTDPNDFPDNIRAALDRGLPRFLQSEAAKIGESFTHLIRNILTPHAFINLRRAQGLLSVAKLYPKELIERAARQLGPKNRISPKYFRILVEKLNAQLELETANTLPLGEETRTFIRTNDYFKHPS